MYSDFVKLQIWPFLRKTYRILFNLKYSNYCFGKMKKNTWQEVGFRDLREGAFGHILVTSGTFSQLEASHLSQSSSWKITITTETAKSRTGGFNQVENILLIDFWAKSKFSSRKYITSKNFKVSISKNIP